MRPVRFLIVGMALLATGGCRSSGPEQQAPPCLTLATGSSDDVSYLFGAALARLFNERAAGRCLAGQLTDGSSFNVMALDDASVDFALARADTVYSAYVDGTPLRPRPHRSLRGMAIVYGSVLHFFVRSDSSIRDWKALRDQVVGLSIFSATDLAPIVGYTGLVTAAGDLGPLSFKGVRMRLAELTQALASNEIAAGAVLTAHPVPTLVEFAEDVNVRLLEIEPDAAARIRSRYPFFKPVSIPAGVYPGQHTPVRTIAVENLLVTRAELEDEVVYLATKTLLENLEALSRDHGAALQVNAEQASATPVPLHPGAARYYRERELLR